VSQFRHAESVEIDAPSEFVYDLVTDIGRTGEWSPICTGCTWRDEPGAREGAWFAGRNETEGLTWETTSQVAVARRGREFTWFVWGTGQFVRWGYSMDAIDDRRTRLIESWELLPALEKMFHDKYGAEGGDAKIEMRRRQALHGIPATLKAIKRIAEAEFAASAR